jgi:lycopene cyclase domain-containing protein
VRRWPVTEPQVVQVSHLAYVAILAACLIGTAPLEFVLGTRVYARWRRLALTLLPVVVLFGAWDEYAIAHGLWTYDPDRITGIYLPQRLPLEELLFFVVTPTCAVLTLEAVRRRRPSWTVGDEP